MGLAEKLSALRTSAENQLHALDTEEKTKNALLLPFLDVLGYDPFNIQEVEPGHAVGLNGDVTRVDYAVNIDGTPAMLFQCEEANADLGAFSSNPLYRHFGDSESNIVVRTNGLDYRFYADFGTEGQVDSRPFLQFNLLDQEPEQITYLKRLTKPAFDTQKVLSAAFELKHTRLLQNYFVQQREDLDAHFVRFLAAQVCEGEVSEETLERFQPVVQKLLQRFDMETVDFEDHAPPQTNKAETAHPEAPAEREPSDSEEDEGTAPHNENGEPEENGISEEDLDDEELQGGGNIAKEFANKVVGES